MTEIYTLRFNFCLSQFEVDLFSSRVKSHFFLDEVATSKSKRVRLQWDGRLPGLTG